MNLEPLIKSLQEGTIPFLEIMSAYNIKATLCTDLPPDVLGFVYVSKRGNYHLILNAETSLPQRLKTFIHEIKHITTDLPKAGYIIGLNMQHMQFERDADYISEKLAAYSFCR